MEIGEKLKNARNDNGLTQEQVAAEIGVSRQSVSNWENNRAYPDIVSVIKLSDLYSVSLDDLLKEDKKMIEHLDEATNEVKSRRWLSKLIEVGSFLVVWAVTAMTFWAGAAEGSNAMSYSILALYIVMPVSTLVISFIIGADRGWNKLKWLMVLFFGMALIMTDMETFGIKWLSTLETVSATDFFLTFKPMYFVIGAVVSALGIGTGTVVRSKKIKKQTE
ncbi:MAG: helix-turn-helix transcriptional regulator [Ruminococcaceae bacterium]|nr:helix-turn-helix transcriptional regulator [Oscillospiraceae bacterium]